MVPQSSLCFFGALRPDEEEEEEEEEREEEEEEVSTALPCAVPVPQQTRTNCASGPNERPRKQLVLAVSQLSQTIATSTCNQHCLQICPDMKLWSCSAKASTVV